MTPHLLRTIDSFRAVQRLELQHARRARRAGHASARAWHLAQALQIRADIHHLIATA